MVEPNTFYYKEQPGIRNVSTREKFTVIFDNTSVNGVTYEGRCQLPLDEALKRLDKPIWQIWRSGTRAITVDSINYTSGSHTIEGIYNRNYLQVWDDRASIFGDDIIAAADAFSIETDGISKYLTGGDVLNMPRLSPKTFVFWYRPLTTAVERALINKIEPGGSFKGYQLLHNSNGTLTFFLLNSLSNYAAVTTATAIASITAWFHIIITYSGDSGDVGNFNIYINSVAESLTNTNNTLNQPTTNTRDFNIARRSDNSRYTVARFHEMGVYDIEFSQSQANEAYNGGDKIDLRTLSTAASLEASWRFTQTDIDNFPTIEDASGNSIDLTTVNMTSDDIVLDTP